jgi:hypothetical protein
MKVGGQGTGRDGWGVQDVVLDATYLCSLRVNGLSSFRIYHTIGGCTAQEEACSGFLPQPWPEGLNILISCVIVDAADVH